MKLQGRVSIITGAGGYLGREMALLFSENGSAVMVNDVNMKTAMETAKLVTDRGGEAIANGANVTKAAEVEEMVRQATDRWGKVDVLVNNAGDIRDAMLPKMTEEDWDFVINLNLKGSFLCARAVVPQMIERGYGKIVNITSMAYKGNAGQANYSSAKAGLVGFTRALGLELARHRINVNCVSPGLIETPRTGTLDQSTRERIIRLTPMRCMGEVNDIAHAVLFFASDDSKFITRQVIHVSGGMEGF